MQRVRVARGENHLGPLVARQAGRLEADAGAAADHEDGLPEQVRWPCPGEGAAEVTMVLAVVDVASDQQGPASHSSRRHLPWPLGGGDLLAQDLSASR